MKNNDKYYEDARERIDTSITLKQWCEELEKENERLSSELEEVKKELSELREFINLQRKLYTLELGRHSPEDLDRYKQLKKLVGADDE